MTCTLRDPTYADFDWMKEMFKAWPHGIVSEHMVSLMLRRWIERGHPSCRVLIEGDEPRGLITYRLYPFFVMKVGIAMIKAEFQDMGYGGQMFQLVRDEVEPQGVVVAYIPNVLKGSPIEGRYPDNTIAIGDPL